MMMLVHVSGNCQEGIACSNAHNLGELRTLAAIQQHNIQASFKTERCSAYDSSHKCPRGVQACHHDSCCARIAAQHNSSHLLMKICNKVEICHQPDINCM